MTSAAVLSRSLESFGVRPASELGARGTTAGRMFPVFPEIAKLLPGRGLAGGSTVSVRGSASLLLALLGAASAAGSWAAVVGMPELGILAAVEMGVEPSRLAIVAPPGDRVATVTSALLGGVDLVVVAAECVTGQAAAGGRGVALARRLSARARRDGSVLVAFGRWPGADVEVECVAGRWSGLGRSHGYLRERRMTVVASGRGAAAREVRAELLLPACHGGIGGGASDLEEGPRRALRAVG